MVGISGAGASFAVDDVTRAIDAPDSVTVDEALGARVVASLAPRARVLRPRGVHPLLDAIDRAFAEHRPLVLTPDGVWITIARGIAEHVGAHAEELRARFVKKGGSRPIEIGWGGTLPESADDWERILAVFRLGVADEIGRGLARFFRCDFSTTTSADAAAGDVVLAGAIARWTDLKVFGWCGIPELTVRGTANDWARMKGRLGVMDELGLGFWTRSLAPVLDALGAASEGRADVELFRALYKPKRAYLADRMSGWIGRLFPYVRDGGELARNPLLDAPMLARKGGPSIRLDDVAGGVATIGVRARGPAFASAIDATIEGGLIAVEVDDDHRLVPRPGFVVRRFVEVEDDAYSFGSL